MRLFVTASLAFLLLGCASQEPPTVPPCGNPPFVPPCQLPVVYGAPPPVYSDIPPPLTGRQK